MHLLLKLLYAPVRRKCSRFAYGTSCTLAAPLGSSKIEDRQPSCEVATMHKHNPIIYPYRIPI